MKGKPKDKQDEGVILKVRKLKKSITVKLKSSCRKNFSD